MNKWNIIAGVGTAVALAGGAASLAPGSNAAAISSEEFNERQADASQLIHDLEEDGRSVPEFDGGLVTTAELDTAFRRAQSCASSLGDVTLVHKGAGDLSIRVAAQRSVDGVDSLQSSAETCVQEHFDPAASVYATLFKPTADQREGLPKCSTDSTDDARACREGRAETLRSIVTLNASAHG
jgi:hypothetical protein